MPRFDAADEYFNRSYETVTGTPYEHMPVVYGVFCREPGMITGMQDVLELINNHCPGPVTVRALSDGDRFEPMHIVMTLEGPFGQLVTLETTYLGILSLSAATANMAAIVEAANPAQVIDMAARHYPPELLVAIAEAAAVGGAAGTTTPLGHAAVITRYGISDDRIQIGSRDSTSFRLHATIPHALNAVYGGNSIESAAAYNHRCPAASLTVLLDDEGRERDICSEAVKRFGSSLYGVRLDTPANRVHQGGHEKADRALEMRILSQVPPADRKAAMAALARHGFGPGVTIEAAYTIRDLLDKLGSRHTRLVLSGDFDLDKVRAFRLCNAPADYITTGSWVRFGIFTSDILRVFENDHWIPRCKTGRGGELIEPDGLPVVLQKNAPTASPPETDEPKVL
ncbi:MAG TPA: hypothetical protein PKY77_05375 [Phycisphaerae bacterium]|nr:hypothetical protein [Phycisphaerae bacterium]HRY68944.1 hypothetical protein [Phycisphaerae bacterium]HSA25771.1 hypothetical protein [Phycisphaerae bacterium]